VCVGGGYVAGGGHGYLTNVYGLAASNTLEFQVVLANGTITFANERHNADLFWALNGGAGGNYAVVTGVTSKTSPHPIIFGTNLTIAANPKNKSPFIDAVAYLYTQYAAVTDAGISAYPALVPNVSWTGPLLGFNKTQEQVDQVMAPILRNLSTYEITLLSNDIDGAVLNTTGEAPPSSTIMDNTQMFSRESLSNFTAVRTMLEKVLPKVTFSLPYLVGGVGPQKDLRAANPAWRETISHTICNTILPDPEYNMMVGNFTQAVDTIGAFMRPLSVNNSCYGNEVRMLGDFYHDPASLVSY
jgi:hypothetical protein